MVAPGGLVVGVVVFHKGGGILGQRVRHAAAQGIAAALVVLCALAVEGLPLGVAVGFAVLGVKITLGVHPRHVIHGGGHGGLDPGVQGGGVQGHAAPARRCR